MRRFKVCRRRISRISIGSILVLGGSLEECPFLLLLFLDLLVCLVFLLGSWWFTHVGLGHSRSPPECALGV